MSWIFEVALELLFEVLGYLWPWGHRHDDRSVVGTSRLEQETARFWKWVAIAALAIGAVIWLIFYA